MASTSSRPSYRQPTTAYAAATAVAGVAVLAFGIWLGGDFAQSRISGLTGSNALTGWGLPISKLAVNLSSVGVVGMLVACILMPVHERELSAAPRRCLRTAGWLALVWGVSAAALLMFDWSDIVGRPVTSLPIRELFTDTTTTFPNAVSYISTTALALVISAAVYITETKRGALILLPLAAYNIVPLAVQGHAGHGTLAKYSLIVHVIAVSLWVGGLAALLVHARRSSALLAVAVPRFSTLALTCYVTVAGSGLIAAWVNLESVSAIWGSRYGVLVMFKASALITLGILGWWHRRHTVHRIGAGEGRRARRAFIQLAAAEVVVMIAAVALGVALSRTASPATTRLHAAFSQQVQTGTRNA
jgi:putative copper resistance protein D